MLQQHSNRRRNTRIGLVVGAVALSLAAAPTFGSSSAAVRFGKPVIVDQQLAGGEPSVFWDPAHQDFIYSSHEGTTHTLRDGLASPSGDAGVAENYRNQVNIWTSRDGKKWVRTNLSGTGFEASPSNNTGFSDPDLTQDDGGRIYNTGIDLVNDALFSSPDGGKTWDKGTLNCHDGDRPWLAGGPKDTVWLANDPNTGNHTIWQSTNAGTSCGSTGIEHPSGYGKLFYDKVKSSKLYGALIEPSPSVQGGIGVGILRNALGAFKAGKGTFVDHKVADTDGELTHFPSIELDSAGNIYMTWTDYPGGTKGSGKNTVWLSMSKDGVHWTKKYAVAHPGTTVLWPWVVAGTPGNANVVWWQYDRPTPNPDSATTGNVSLMAANIYGLGTSHVHKSVVNAAGRPIHVGGICQGGTTCVATGQDRRLGDYFTNWIDSKGCVIIASGDTTVKDPITGKDKAWSTPIFLHQSAGPSLTGKSCGTSSSRGVIAALPAGGLSSIGRALAQRGPVGLLVLLLVTAAAAGRRMRRWGIRSVVTA
jgi:hypothetical protein